MCSMALTSSWRFRRWQAGQMPSRNRKASRPHRGQEGPGVSQSVPWAIGLLYARVPLV